MSFSLISNLKKMDDKIKGMIVGACMGDALGAPYELRNSRSLTEYNSLFAAAPLTQFYNRYTKEMKYMARGQYTDDGELTVLLFKSLSENSKQYNKEIMVLRYLEWANSTNNRCMGKNTRRLFKGVTTNRGYISRFNKAFTSQHLRDAAQSNGALMRCSPLAIIENSPDRRLAVMDDCSITNPSYVAVGINVIYVELLHSILSGEKDPEHLNKIIETTSGKYLKNKIKIKPISRFDTPRNVTNNKGWCVHGLFCALYGLNKAIKGGEMLDILSEIISWGGDTDTNACIAGAMLGAFFGFNNMNSEEKLRQNIEILLNSNWQDGDLDRPQKYQLKYLNF
jgi:ADP-ribosylglycohydrolase